jgi:hypothetical protein
MMKSGGLARWRACEFVAREEGFEFVPLNVRFEVDQVSEPFLTRS